MKITSEIVRNVSKWEQTLKNKDCIMLSHKQHGVVTIVKDLYTGKNIQIRHNGAIVKFFTNQDDALMFTFHYIHDLMEGKIAGKRMYNIAS